MTRHETTSQEAFIIEDGIEVPESALLRVERDRGYGSVPGLEDEELAGPRELERQIFIAEWGPLLALPWEISRCAIRPVLDEFGHLDWGAFGTVDFDRIRPPFDKARYKADKLHEQLRNDLIMLDMVRERVRPEARERIRELALHTQVDVDTIDDWDEWAYAGWLRRVQRVSIELGRVRGFIRRRRFWGQGS